MTVGLVAAKATSPSVEMMFPEPLPLTALLLVMKFPVAEVLMPFLYVVVNSMVCLVAATTAHVG